jgi:hypothetical protein
MGLSGQWQESCIVGSNMASSRQELRSGVSSAAVSSPYFKALVSRFGAIFLTAVLTVSVSVANTGKPPAGEAPSQAPIVIGFVGGFVHHDDSRHAEVQLADKLRSAYPGRLHVRIFENRHRQEARTAIFNWLDSDNDGNVSVSEKRDAHIILYGHSWGGSAVVALARELQRDHIPVVLTIQVDSIAKPGLDDHTIPSNVAHAVNFYQTSGPLHGDRQIIAADPIHTQILGDFRFNYDHEPKPCSTYPWFSRHFLKGHISIECDPNVWSRIQTLIGEYLSSSETQAAAVTDRNF